MCFVTGHGFSRCTDFNLLKESVQGLKPKLNWRLFRTTTVVPCYKAYEFSILREALQARLKEDLDTFALPNAVFMHISQVPPVTYLLIAGRR